MARTTLLSATASRFTLAASILLTVAGCETAEIPPPGQALQSLSSPTGQIVDRSGRAWTISARDPYFAASGRSCVPAELRAADQPGLSIARTLCLDSGGAWRVSEPLRTAPGDPRPLFATMTNDGPPRPAYEPCDRLLEPPGRDETNAWQDTPQTDNCP